VSGSLLTDNAFAVWAMMTVLWLVSVARRDASLVDPWWSMGFLLLTARTVVATGPTPAKWLLLGVVALWSLRLWAHLLWRSRGKPEDPRYVAFRQRYGAHRYWWVSYFQVFLLQGALMLLVSAPLQLAASSLRDVGLWQALGAAAAVAGTVYEAVADHQLQQFRDDPAHRGQVMARGLWRWSRHPNYFGESVVWWGFGLMALGQAWGWTTLAGPALMTWLLLRVSGVTMLDAHLLSTRPGYAAYLRRTSAFWPRPPRDSTASAM
jgi:steroid 5-alpha reductase family enzyme